MTVGQVEKLSQQCDGRRNEKRACEERVRLRRRRAGELVFNDISAPKQHGDREEEDWRGENAKSAFALRHRFVGGIRTPGITRDLSMALPPLSACAAGGSSIRRKSRYENDGAAYFFFMIPPQAQRGFCPSISPLTSNNDLASASGIHAVPSFLRFHQHGAPSVRRLFRC